MVRHYYKKRYRIQDKKYYQKLLNFDNTVRERYCYDDYLLTPVSEILGVDNNTIKKMRRNILRYCDEKDGDRTQIYW